MFSFSKMAWPGTKVLRQTLKNSYDRASGKYRSWKLFGSLHGFVVFTAARYIGGYIRYDEYKRDWMKECTET